MLLRVEVHPGLLLVGWIVWYSHPTAATRSPGGLDEYQALHAIDAQAIIAVCTQYTYIGTVESNFDPKKNAINLRKHGVSLAEGDGVLNDT